MAETRLSILAAVAAWATTSSAVWLLFDKAEEVIKPSTRAAVTQWLKGLDPSKFGRAWPSTFLAIFDSIFDRRHLSWRRFGMSSLCSLILVCVIAVWWHAAHAEYTRILFQSVGTKQVVLVIFYFAITTNLLIDYVSVAQTRIFIGLMARKGGLWIPFLLLVDALATYLIFLIGTIISILVSFKLSVVTCHFPYLGQLYNSLFGFCTDEIPLTTYVSGYYEDIIHSAPRLAIDGRIANIGIFLYSAFFTSFWLWTYVLVGTVIRISRPFLIPLKLATNILDVELAPLRAIGYVTVLMITILFIVLTTVLHLSAS